MRVGIVRPQRERSRERVARGRQVGQRVLRRAQQLARPEMAWLQLRCRPAQKSQRMPLPWRVLMCKDGKIAGSSAFESCKGGDLKRQSRHGMYISS